MSQAYSWVRAHLKRNNFRPQPNDPPEVTRFMFYLEMHTNQDCTFRRTFLACRMNAKYFAEYDDEGIATAWQKAYVRAVTEANDPTTWSDYTQREAFLKMFDDKPMNLHRPSGVEKQYLDRQIAHRMCKRLIDQYEQHVTGVHYMTVRQKAICKDRFEYWIVKFAQLPIVTDQQVAELRMEVVTDMLDQVGLNEWRMDWSTSG